MKLLLIDGHYYVYRSFFAIQNLSNSRGEPTNAIYGFVKTVRKMIKDVQPNRAAVLWDVGLPKRRTELQPDYKVNRAEMPDPMRPQLEFIQRIVPMMGLVSIGVEDTEADDLIACYTKAACKAADAEVVLATNDKDLFQLVDGCVRIYSTNKSDLASPKDSHALLGAEAVRAKWGVEPEQIGDVLALIGDSVDNIPGVPGFGPKTAVNLLNEFGSLEKLLADLSVVKNEKLRSKLEGARSQIAANREMVRLDCHLDLPVPIDDLVIRPRYDELIPALRGCEFKALLAEVEAEAATAVSRVAAGESQGELF